MNFIGSDFSRLRDEVSTAIQDFDPNVVWISGAWAWPLTDMIDRPMIVDVPNSERLTVDREIMSLLRALPKNPGRLARVISLLLDRRPRIELERRVLAHSAAVTACSANDLPHVVIPGEVEPLMVPNGVDKPPTGYLRSATDPRMLLVGDLYYEPNAEAARVLVGQVLPRVRKIHPKASVDLVGVCPVSLMRELASDSATFHGYVADLAPYYARAALCVLPVYSGSGTRTKVLEACSFEVPVLTTPLGVEGLPLVAGEEVVVAEDPEALAAEALGLLANPGRAGQLARAGYVAVQERFTWERSVAPLAQLVIELSRGEMK